MCESSDAYAIDGDNIGFCFSCNKFYNETTKQIEAGRKNMQENQERKELKPLEYGDIVELTARGISKDTCAKYNYQVSKDGKKHLAFLPEGAQKIRFIDEKRFLYINKPRHNVLFGQDIFEGDSSKPLLITEGEIDAMSAHQMLNVPAVSISHGTNSASRCIQDQLDYLKKFSCVILAFDNDEAGKDATDKVLKLLKDTSIDVVALVMPDDTKDLNDCLSLGYDVEVAEEIDKLTAKLEDNLENDKYKYHYIASKDAFYFIDGLGQLVFYKSHGFRGHLRLRYPDKDKAAIGSMVDSIMGSEAGTYCHDIAVMPYQRFGRVDVNGKLYLNTFTIKPCQPRRGHPTVILKLFKEMFGDTQYMYFMSWLSYFYKNCHAFAPKPGNALYLAGDQGAGKGLFHDGILPALVGKGADGMSLLNSSFTGLVFQHPFVKFPDKITTLTEQQRVKFTGVVKDLVANNDRVINNKYGSMDNIEWAGRVIISLNLGERSSDALPDYDPEDSDKYMLLHVKHEETIDKYNMDGWKAVIQEEKHALAHYLLSFEIPEELVDQRFGVKAYHNKLLLEEMEYNNPAMGYARLLQQYLEESNSPSMRDTAGNIFDAIKCFDDTRPEHMRTLPGQMRANGFGRKLTELQKLVPWIIKVRDNGKRLYVIKKQ
jgi:hypothetical protein